MFIYSLLMMGITSSVFLLNPLCCYVVFRYESLHDVSSSVYMLTILYNNKRLLWIVLENALPMLITPYVCYCVGYIAIVSLLASLYSPLSIFWWTLTSNIKCNEYITWMRKRAELVNPEIYSHLLGKDSTCFKMVICIM